MALSAKVVTYTANTTTGDQTLASAGFTPKCAIVYFSRSTTAVDTFTEHFNIGFGFTDGTNSRCEYAGSEDNQTSSNTIRIDRNDCLIVTHDISGTLATQDGKATFSSFNSDGMVINWSDAPAAAFKFHVLYLGGADLTNVFVGNYTTSTSTGNQDITGVGFQPDFILQFTVNGTVNSTGTGCRPCFGAAVSSSAMWSQSMCSENGRTTMDTWQSYTHTNMVQLLSSTTGAVSDTFDFVSFLSDGFRINNDDITGATYYYLALKGGSYAVGNDTEPTGTGNQTVTTNTDVKAVMIFGNDTGTADAEQTDNMWTMGAGTSSSNMACVVAHDTDNTADSVNVSRYETDSIYLNITANATATSSTVDDEASLSSVSSSGFVLNWSNVGNARPFRYVTFGNGFTSYQRSPSESAVSVNQSITRTRTTPRTISESSITVNQTLSRILSALRTIPESSVSIDQSITRLRTTSRTLNESETIDQILSRILSATRTATESESIDASLLRIRTTPRTVSESAVTINQTLSRILLAGRTAIENISTDESLSRIRTTLRTVSEPSITIDQTLLGVSILLRTISESSISIDQSITRVRTTPRTLNESETIDELLSRLLQALRNLNQTTEISENLTYLFTAIRSLPENTSINQTISRILIALRTIPENTNVSEQLTYLFTQVRNISQNTNIDESLARILLAIRSMSQNTTVDELVDAYKYYEGTIIEPLIKWYYSLLTYKI